MTISALGDRTAKISFVGRLDTAGVDRIETRFVASLVPSGKSAIVDLGQVDFVASMGIRMLISTGRSLSMKHGKLALYNTQPQVQQVFDTVALGKIISICSSEEEALAAIG